MDSVDWYRWHDSYDELESSETEKLADIQQLLTDRLTDADCGTIRLLSMAAGQSRELIPVLVNHPRGVDVSAVLVEFDHRNTDFAVGALQSAALRQVSVITGDAGDADHYASGVPADLILCCGLFEHLDEMDTRRTIATLPMLCAQGATIIYSYRDDSSRTALERDFAAVGFTIMGTEVAESSVGGAVFTGTAHAWRPGVRMFELA